MKKKLLCSVLIVASLLLLLSGCDFIMGTDGRDGKAYLKVTVDSTAEAWYGYMEGFPDGWSLNTYYAVSEGVHDAEYALCNYLYYISPYYYFSVNSYDLSDWAVGRTSSSAVDALTYYLSEVGYVFTNTFTFTVNSGTDGALFQDGSDGADKYYSLYLAWNPDYSSMTGNNVELEKTVSTSDDGSSIIEFRDNYRTFTMKINKQTAPAEMKLNSVVKSVQ